jgi:hypothetical protein
VRLWDILTYKWLYVTVVGGINGFINYILEYINVEVASSHSVRGNKYFYKLYVRIAQSV